LIIQDRSVFYEAFSAYFDSLWTSNSVSPEHLTYHFEIEIKAKILDYQAVLKGLEKLDAQLTDSKRYHDHYFTPVDGPYAEDSGEELRVRCDLQRQRMFYTEKRPFREEWAGSKREFEIYVGSTTEQKPFCRSIEARGYRQYSSFFKEADFYTLNYGTFHINIALASVYSEATEEDTESGGHRDFIEIEVIQPEKANEEILKRAHQACENVLEGFGEAVSAVTDETYSGLFAERA
jgi:adenylate cyclase class IV